MFGTDRIYTGINGGGTVTTNMIQGRNWFEMYGNINMEGYKITNAIAYEVISDDRIKKNVTDYTEDALPQINALVIKTFGYDFIDGGGKNELGVVAQDSPQISHISDDGMWTVNTTRATMLLIKAVQELSTKVKALEGTV